MADATDRYAHSIFPSRGLCAEDADVDRREVGPFQTDAFGMQPVTARFAVQLVSGWWCHLQGRGRRTIESSSDHHYPWNCRCIWYRYLGCYIGPYKGLRDQGL